MIVLPGETSSQAQRAHRRALAMVNGDPDPYPSKLTIVMYWGLIVFGVILVVLVVTGR